MQNNTAIYGVNNTNTQEVAAHMSTPAQILPIDGKSMLEKLTMIEGTSGALCRNFCTTEAGPMTLGFQLGKEQAIIDTDRRKVTLGLDKGRFTKACESGNNDDLWYATENLASTCIQMGDVIDGKNNEIDQLKAQNVLLARNYNKLSRSYAVAGVTAGVACGVAALGIVYAIHNHKVSKRLKKDNQALMDLLEKDAEA